MFSGGDCFGAQCRNSCASCHLRHSVADEAHRQDQYRIGQIQETASKFLSPLAGPTSSEGSTSCADDTLAKSHVVQVGGGKFIRCDELAEAASLFTGEDVAEGDRRGRRDSRRGEIGVVSQGGDECRMVLAAKEIAEKALRLTRGDGEHAKTQVDHVDRSSLVEMPPMANVCRYRHLTRRGHEILPDFGHGFMILGNW